MNSTVTKVWGGAVTVALVMAGAACSSGGAAGGHPSSSSSSESSSAHVLSASRACKDFAVWYLAYKNSLTSQASLSALSSAVAEAPSGSLYQDLSTVESNLQSASQAQGSLQQAETNYAIASIQSAENDCQAVNPNGS